MSAVPTQFCQLNPDIRKENGHRAARSEWCRPDLANIMQISAMSKVRQLKVPYLTSATAVDRLGQNDVGTVKTIYSEYCLATSLKK